MTRQPLLILLICFILGVNIREFLEIPTNLLWISFGLSLFLLVSLFIKSNLCYRLRPYVIGYFFFNIGFIFHHSNLKEPVIINFEKNEEFVFKIEKKLNSNIKNRKYIISIIDRQNSTDKSNLPISMVLNVPNNSNQLDYKNYYKAKLYINPVIAPDNDYQFNYQKYLARQSIFHQAFVSGEILSSPKDKIGFSEKIKQSRIDLLESINKSALSTKVQQFLKAIILADRTDMDSQTIKDFNETGLTHLLAISGAHMVIIFFVLMHFLKFVLPNRIKKYNILCSLLALWLFTIFIDFGNSVVRSCLMITCYYLMRMMERKTDLLHAMSLSAFIILIIDTHQFFDVGFQLSYVAVLGIWWLTIPIQKLLFRYPHYFLEKFFYQLIALTIAAQISTLPLVIYYFNQYSYVSIIANLVIIPLSEILIVSSLVMVIIIGLGFDRILMINHLFDNFINGVLQIIHHFGKADFLMLKYLSLSFLELIILMMGLYFLRFILIDYKSVKNYIKFTSVLLLFFLVKYTYDLYYYQKNEVKIHSFSKQNIISIKQNDVVWFWLPKNVDHQKVNDFVIKPYMASRRVKKLHIKDMPLNADAFSYKGRYYELATNNN